MLTFDEPTHTYRWKGAVVAHVTGVLAPLIDYSMIPAEMLELARQKGQAVHKMVELDCGNDLNVDDLPEWLIGPLSKWRTFQRDTGFRVIASEYRVYHGGVRVAGTLDLYGEMVQAGKFAFIDLKRSFYAGRAIGIQLAAYREMYATQERDAMAAKAERYALKLNEREPMRLERYTEEGQWYEFLALLAAQRIKEKYTK